MNPNRGGEQPTPNFETFAPGSQEVYTASPDRRVEAPRTPESSPSSQSAPPVPVPIAPLVIADNQDDTSVTSVISSNPSLNMPAADSNKIERQWVEKAKSIIAQTKDDPFTQKNEMSKVKAAYIEKRYNKKLKVDDAKV